MKVLYLDIEVAPSKAYIWDLKTRYVPLDHIAEDGYVLCFSYKWGDQGKIHFFSRWDHGEEAMVLEAWRILDEADVVVHFNGLNYDIPRLKAEFLRYRLGPYSPVAHVDLYQASKQFKVLSRSMKHMLHILGLESKMEHKGMKLWEGCMNGIKEDERKMREYNLQDIRVMPALYNELRPWISNHPNMRLYVEHIDDELHCPRCDSTDLRHKGYKHTKVMSYKQYHCGSCGFYPRERTAVKSKREDVLTW